MKKPIWEIRSPEGRQKVARWLDQMLDGAASINPAAESCRKWYLDSHLQRHGAGTVIRRLRAGDGTAEDQMLAATFMARSSLPKRAGAQRKSAERPTQNPPLLTALGELTSLKHIIWEHFGRDNEVHDFACERVIERNLVEWLYYESKTPGSPYEDKFQALIRLDPTARSKSQWIQQARRELVEGLDRQLGIA